MDQGTVAGRVSSHLNHCLAISSCYYCRYAESHVFYHYRVSHRTELL
jgi:hypothetical protein